MRRGLLVGFLFGCLPPALMAAPVNLDTFLARDQFQQIQLSPDGSQMAASVPLDDRTGLVIIRLADNTVTGTFSPPSNNHVADFSWANSDRVLLALGEKFGRLEQPQPTGEIYSASASGGRGELLVGYRVQSNSAGTRIPGKQAEGVAAHVIAGGQVDADHVLIRVIPFSEEPVTRVERMNVRTGKRTLVVRAPVLRADFLTDPAGAVRFAWGAESDNAQKLYHRSPAGEGWTLVNDQQASGRVELPLGMNEAGTVAYLRVSQPLGPDAVVAWDIASDQRREILRPAVGDPVRVLYRPGTRIPVGVEVALPTPHTLFFDEASADAQRQRNLETAFGGPVRVTSTSSDGRWLLVNTYSDRNPGDFYLVDSQNQKAQHLVSRARQIDPEAMAPTRAISLPARDGLILHGYLTVPAGGGEGPRPMVVLPHGGPYGIHDEWEFDGERQLLAAAGYAVLQLNFRGSGGLGMAYQRIGARQWGATMQDDLTDATHWAVAQGVADPQRICIYGASYGGYAALMGVAREPALYRCAAGYVGVYDLPMLHRERADQARWAGKWSLEWVGDDMQQLRARSPSALAGQIRVPVFLAAGGEDRIAPVRHTEQMEAALRQAGVPVTTLYRRNEGHGFYLAENRRAYYAALLDFLAEHIGGERAAP